MIERWGPIAAALSVVLGMFLFLLAGVYTFRQQEHVNSRLCENAVDNRVSQRAVWETVRSLLLESAENPEAVNKLVDGILESIPVLVCIDNRVKEAT